MARSLELNVEPADAFSALLRLKATMEAGRCPPELSTTFRQSVEAEFAHLEDAVRTLGVCLAQLEESGLASLDRGALSRFGDINNALHLVALPASLTVDLDVVRVALDRGDPDTRSQASTVATAVRALLWYASHTDLLICTQLILASAEVPPDRALRYVDAQWGAAWAPGPAPQPPDPRRGRGGSGAGSLDLRSALTPAAPMPLVRPVSPASLAGESTAVMRSPLSEIPEALLPGLPGSQRPLPPSPHPVGYLGREQTTPAVGLLQLLHELPTARRNALEAEVAAGVTVQMKATEILSDDARLFLSATGAGWPCDLGALETAHRSLRARGSNGASIPPEQLEVLLPRLEQGYAELRGLLGA